MKTSIAATLCIPIGAVALTGFARTARGDEVVTPKRYVLKDETVSSGPNRALLHSGIWTLGLSYVPAVVVAAESNRVADKRLYVPVAGPWLDLASRGSCYPNNTPCNHETTNKVLIVVDGIFQGIGALNIVGAFLFPETRTVTVSSAAPEGKRVSSLTVHLVPAQVGGRAYGLAAIGTF